MQLIQAKLNYIVEKEEKKRSVRFGPSFTTSQALQHNLQHGPSFL